MVDRMRVVVIGLGSMGKRRIRLMRRAYPDIQICGVDTSKERRQQAEDMYDISTLESLAFVKEGDFECAFIASSPLTHHHLIRECLLKNIHVFTEINLVDDGYDDNIRLAAEKKKVLFLSSTFLYREETGYIADKVKQSQCAVNYLYHIGQYLPDWHPWENYQNYFVGDKRTNGCRELFAIELPWILHTFGDVQKLQVAKGRNTNLAIDYPDYYMVTMEHENGTKGVLAVDVVSRKAVRKLEVYAQDLYLSWNGTPESLFEYDYQTKQDVPVRLYETIEQNENYAGFIIENAYLHEIEAFFGQVEKNIAPVYDFKKDKKTLALIEEIEKRDD